MAARVNRPTGAMEIPPGVVLLLGGTGSGRMRHRSETKFQRVAWHLWLRELFVLRCCAEFPDASFLMITVPCTVASSGGRSQNSGKDWLPTVSDGSGDERSGPSPRGRLELSHWQPFDLEVGEFLGGQFAGGRGARVGPVLVWIACSLNIRTSSSFCGWVEVGLGSCGSGPKDPEK